VTGDAGTNESPNEELASAAGHLPLPLVPPEVSRRVRNVFGARQTVIEADLVADTRRDDALVGVRGGVASAWTMSYKAGQCDIVIDAVPRSSGIEISGQLLCPEPASDTILRVFRGDEFVLAGSTDEHGQFELGELPRAEYAIAARRSEHVIEIAIDLVDGTDR